MSEQSAIQKVSDGQAESRTASDRADAEFSGLKFLIIEDNPDDAFLLSHIVRTNFPHSAATHAENRRALASYLESAQKPDIVLSDWAMPQFGGLAALEMVRGAGIHSPFIIVSGTIGEESAVRAVRAGAYDYVLKDKLGRLPTSIKHALEQVDSQKEAIERNARIALQAAAMEAAPAAILLVKTSGTIEWANTAYFTLTGYDRAEIIGRPCSESCGEFISGSLATILEETRRTGEYRFSGIEYRKDGRAYLEERRIRIVNDEKGTPEYLVVTKQDITAESQKKRELELDIATSGTLKTAKFPEELCRLAVELLQREFPASISGILLLSDGASHHESWHGSSYASAGLSEEELKAALERDESSAPHKKTLFLREVFVTDEKVASLWMRANPDAPYDINALFEITAHHFEAALQAMVIERKMTAQIRNVTFLKSIGHSRGSGIDFDELLRMIMRRLQRLLDCDASSLFLRDKDSDSLVQKACFGLRAGDMPNSIVKFDEPYVGISAREQRVVEVSDFRDIDPDSPFGAFLHTEGFKVQLCAPIVLGGKTMGVLEVFFRRKLKVDRLWYVLFDAVAAQLGLAIDYNGIFSELQKAYEDLELSYNATIEGWSAAMDYRDHETEGHSQRVTSMAVALASLLGCSDDQIAAVKRGALLHDIGKIGIPDSILLKPGKLDSQEWALMKRHSRIGYDMLAKIPYLQDSLDIPLHHHEKWDGSGYPDGLKGEDIPLSARIFAVVDVFDALTSDRPYRKAESKTQARAYILSESGRHFDPTVVEKFVELLDAR